MKREKKLTKRERKAAAGGPTGGGHAHGEQHIHCVACGRHLDGAEFDDPATATVVSCNHGSSFPSCVSCVPKTRELLAEHDRTGQPVKTAGAWH
jgi:hypothetical protein